MNSLETEVNWALKKIISENLIGDEDSAVILQSWNQLNEYLKHLKDSFPKETLHAIAIKTNPHPEVLKHIVNLGFGLEAASIEEVYLAIQTGISFDKIVFDSPVKTKKEILNCHENYPGIKLNVNCLEELSRIPENPSFTLGIRINPMIDTGAPSLYHVSSDESKFGVPISEKEELLKAILEFPVTQLHVHAGSHMTNLDSSISAIEKLVELADEANELLSQFGVTRRIKFLDIGGGLPPEKLDSESKSRMQLYAENLYKKIPELSNYQVITEFGQWCYFHTGYAFSQVEYTLKRGEKNIAFIHLGADYLMRDAYSRPRGITYKTYTNIGQEKNSEIQTFDLAGPLCFAGDYLAKDLSLNTPTEGDWLAMLNTGSNSYGLWSRHCSRKIPKVFGVDFKQEKIELLSERKAFIEDLP
jgi:diaminopimelate decarboxylase